MRYGDGWCATCGRLRALTKAGFVVAHGHPERKLRRCSGSGKPPVAFPSGPG